MKILLYSPYMGKHFGGGEKYLLDSASILQTEHQVFLGISQDDIKEIDFKDLKSKYQKFFDINLDKVKFIKSPLFSSNSFFNKLLWTKQFDAIIYETDGSLFFSLAKKNILHIQTPLILDKSSLLEKLKLKNWQIKNTNSKFTKNVIEKSWQTKIDIIHYPMVENVKLNAFINKKQKIILNVGRFFSHQHSKRQDVLVEIYQQLAKKYPKIIKDWQLILIGSVEDEAFAKKVKEMTKGLNIKIIHDVSRDQIINYYKKSSIYWHATGFAIDQDKHPEKVEHFGISSVEAMAHACVPILINKGGQREILGRELEHLLWPDIASCIAITIDNIKNKELRLKTAKLAAKRAKKFGKLEFKNKLMKMLGEKQ